MAKHVERRAYPFELRSAKPDGSYFEGHCAVFHNIDSYGSIMGRGAFSKRLPSFLATGFVAGLNHDWDNPIGTPRTAAEDEIGLAVSADVIDSTHALDVRKYLATKTCKRMSFGFSVYGQTFLDTSDDVKSYWVSAGYTPTAEDISRCEYGAVLFTDIQVYECSPVMFPANEAADITNVRDKAPAERPSLDTLLRSGASTVEEVCAAVERFCDMRSKDGKSIQPERRALLLKMRDRLARALELTTTKADPAAVLALRRDLVRMSVGMHKPSGIE